MLGRYRVLASPRQAARVAAAEGVICAGQIVRDHTLAGLRGRLAGWHDGRRLEPRQAPAAGSVLSDIGLGEALTLRRRRRG